ncbi:FtsX-like permease family protein [Fontibacillus panacisegetis]|uniref:FtsX-like permease family protein n=1 Tax=Fontibacillus panacisegetis TaxID=670482 RepID=A0A1G7I1Z4_9BACL|nr:ABC transporter permease [Fontibacillus panacisegetis]SDF06797.1 FtsX-like permease family protein [Fontibacillus panacisegetis]
MTSFSQVYAALRKKNIKQYALLAGCCFFSVLLITAYVCMMRSPTILNVLPEGGDSRKQVMMIFVLAVLGCGIFTTYASGLFFRHKSRETGIFMALGASRRQLKGLLTRELALLSFASCAAGAVLGAPLAWLIWRLFRLLLVDTEDMPLSFDPQAYLFALAFSVFVIAMLFIMLSRFIRRTNIIDVVNESRKSEPIREVPRRYGPMGIALLVGGGLLGYLTPSFFINVLHWYPPEGLTSITYLPALIGLYLLLLHTVVNGWRQGKNRYKHIIISSMMKFQGRQTVRNMLVITVLVTGAYFASFYTPMLGTGAMMGFDSRKVDYAFHYRSDQDMPGKDEIERMAAEENVTITSYASQPAAILGIDGQKYIETRGSLGVTYTHEYTELLSSGPFLSESAFNALTGDSLNIAPGVVMAVFDDEGNSNYWMSNDVTLITNPVTSEVLHVASSEQVLSNTMLFGRRVLDDTDYARITEGLTDEWLEEQVFFNVNNVSDTYNFAKRLFYTTTDRSSPEVEVYDSWDPVAKMLADQAGEDYVYDKEYLAENGIDAIDYRQRDSSNFRMFWKYMPQFRVLDKADFIKTTAVFLMLFIFIAIICFAAVIVIAYTRSLTIGLTNAQVYDDLRRLGASNSYLLKTVKGQISKVYFTPIFTGTVIIYAFYAMIMYFNDGGNLSGSELAGMANCLVLIAAGSALLYGVYRFTLRKVCGILNIQC